MPARSKKIPMRQCVGCREMKPKRELLRILRTPEDEITIDAAGKKNGRGAYVCPNQDCFLRAVKGKGFERSLKAAIPEEAYAEFEKEMKKIDCR